MRSVHISLFLSFVAAALIEVIYHLPQPPNAVAGTFAAVALMNFIFFMARVED